MGLRTIENASMGDFVYELRRMLNDGIRDPEVRRVAVSVTSPAGRNTEMDIFGYLKNHFINLFLFRAIGIVLYF